MAQHHKERRHTGEVDSLRGRLRDMEVSHPSSLAPPIWAVPCRPSKLSRAGSSKPVTQPEAKRSAPAAALQAKQAEKDEELKSLKRNLRQKELSLLVSTSPGAL